MRSAAPTGWTPQSKPVWFVELGCPAVDKGANAPNLFIDAKSSESTLPPFSTGARDDLIQRRTLEAYLRHWSGGANPVSALTGRPMIEEVFLWCWDARPHPAFPARGDIWADAASWRLGHWLNGRAGLSNLSEVVVDLCRRAGMEHVDAAGLKGAVSGYVADAPASARDLIEPLMAAYDFDAAEREGLLSFFHRGQDEAVSLQEDALTAAGGAAKFAQRSDAADMPIEARVRFLDATRDYLIGAASARRLDRAEGGVVYVDAPLVLEPDAAEAFAERLLADGRAAAETMAIELGPSHVALEPGDRLSLDGSENVFEIVRAEDAAVRTLELRRARAPHAPALFPSDPRHELPLLAPAPVLAVLDIPPLPGRESDERPLAAVFAAPWIGAHAVHAGASGDVRANATQPAVMGELMWDLWPGPVDRWDDGNVVRVKIYGGALSSVTRDDVLGGANAFAIQAGEEWEIVQASRCTLVGPREYDLSGFLRGRLGSAHAMQAPHRAGARIVKLDGRLAPLEVASHERGEPMTLTAPPAGGLANDPRAARATTALLRAAARPWAPAHLRARRAENGDVEASWVRCARIGGDAWGSGEPPLDTMNEAYLVEIWSGAELRRSFTAPSAGCIYTAADQAADFGALPASFRLRVAQIDRFGLPGLNAELTITL